MPTQPPIGIYRPEIDGLRGVAVLAVILFHIDPHWLPGGFVGVDIFFVISGYLITGILAKELREGRFSIVAFYDRRIRRILPALWSLLIVCLPISYWLMLPADAEAAAKSALWSILAMANVYFWREVSTDYFAPESGQMPFLHLWSLGVEEQFYLLWPLALFLVYALWLRRARAIAACLAVVVVIVSTLIAERQISELNTRFAYYMLPARAGELAIGAALALIWPQLAGHFKLRRRDGFGQAAALIGWGLLLVSCICLSELAPFPGWRALLPTLGAAFLIIAGQVGESALLKPLCHPASLWLGRSSYSAYLWHWPILAWWRYLWGQPSATAGALLLIGILLIGGGSQRWIEDPARRVRFSSSRTLCTYLILPALLLGIMALLIARGEKWGLPLYPPTQLQGWQVLKDINRPVHQLDWVCQQHILDTNTLTNHRCEFGRGNDPARVMLLGDSHAAQFAPVFRRAADLQGVRVRSVALGSCAPLPGKLFGVVSNSRLSACEDGMRQVLARAQDFPLLIIGGAWASYSHNDPRVWERLASHLRSLTARGHQVWLLPRVPAVQGYDAACPAKRLRVGDWLTCPTSLPQAAPNDDTNTRLAALARNIKGVKFLSLDTGLCRETRCQIADSQGRFLYADGSHLNVLGAEKLADELVELGQLPDMRAK